MKMKQANSNNYMSTLKQLFDPNSGAGFSMLRIPIGSCDFSINPYFTYDDSSNDELFKNFTWNRDTNTILPVLKDILSINKNIQIMINTWSAPPWMKTSNSFTSGTLRNDMFDDFAYYLQYTIQMYQKEGVQIALVSLQNEPDNEPNSYPVMRLTPANESALAKLLGPKLQSANITTKILILDHNWDLSDYANQVLSDAEARSFIAGTAFHCYAGDVNSQSNVHNAHPDKEIHFTECSGEGVSNFPSNIQWNVNNLYFGSIKNWASSVMQWNLALDTSYGPHFGGCGNCRGVITVQQNYVDVVYNEEFYGMAMISKFLKYPAYRLDCSIGGQSCMSVLCIKNADQSTVVVVANFCSSPQVAAVQNGGSFVQMSLSVGLTTFLW